MLLKFKMQNFSSSRKVFLTCFVVMVILVDGTHEDLASDVKAMETRLNNLEQRQTLSSTYCNLFARDSCGKCLCRDDFKLSRKFYCDCRAEQPRRDCRDFYDNGYHVDGLYVVTMNGYKKTVVYCKQSTKYPGGGWTVIQRRYDGSVNFYRDWLSYKIGFGDLQGEFWAGNENIHLLTTQAIFPSGSEARICASTHNNDDDYRNGCLYYSHFEVASEKSKYTLHVTGNDGTYFTSSDKQPFSTYDQDNDNAPSHHCARDYQYAGWWINGSGDNCASTKTNLNGPYDKYKKRSLENRMNFRGGYHRSYMMLVRRL